MSDRKTMVKWRSGARSPSPRRSPSPPLIRKSMPRRNSTSQNSRFSPKTMSELKRREAKVDRRRLQAEAKSHKLAMQQQQQETRHAKRTQDLEYAIQHKETYGMMTPAAKYGIMAAGVALGGFLLFHHI